MDVTPNPTVHAQKTSLYFFAPLRDSLARELDSPFIKRGTMTHFATRLLIGSALLMALNLHADEAPADGQSPLDELLSTPISTAAKYQQSMSDVAASVTVITAEEIARYGWRSLGEVLTAVRSVYTTSDRGYTYLGVRGVGLPTDYNNRFLILLNGNPLIESVSGSIDVGTGLGIEMSTIERIELCAVPARSCTERARCSASST